MVKVLVLRTAGTNCDQETEYAFRRLGCQTELLHINRLVENKRLLGSFHILAIPGGFTYGDDIASGKVLANELKYKLGRPMGKFIRDGKLIIGICNGFQVLVKAGILPHIDPRGLYGLQSVTLTLNDSAKFEDRWVYLRNVKRKAKNVKCVWTDFEDEMIYLPVAHGEGKFVPRDEAVREELWEDGQVVLQYVNSGGSLAGYPANPNGSVDSIAGICDTTGRIFGLMPHPERHMFVTQHPRWTRRRHRGEADGLKIIKSGVEFARKNL